VIAASAAFMIFFTASSTTLQCARRLYSSVALRPRRHWPRPFSGCRESQRAACARAMCIVSGSHRALTYANSRPRVKLVRVRATSSLDPKVPLRSLQYHRVPKIALNCPGVRLRTLSVGPEVARPLVPPVRVCSSWHPGIRQVHRCGSATTGLRRLVLRHGPHRLLGRPHLGPQGATRSNSRPCARSPPRFLAASRLPRWRSGLYANPVRTSVKVSPSARRSFLRACLCGGST
jgi:hypothetical protein